LLLKGTEELLEIEGFVDREFKATLSAKTKAPLTRKKKTLPTHHLIGRRQKEMSTRFVGIAEGGARTLDLEVGNIMR
jgi:hypothetical protein